MSRGARPIIFDNLPYTVRHGEEVNGGLIELDGNWFTDCRFESCQLVFRGERPFGFTKTQFPNCRFVIEDRAEMVLSQIGQLVTVAPEFTEIVPAPNLRFGIYRTRATYAPATRLSKGAFVGPDGGLVVVGLLIVFGALISFLTREKPRPAKFTDDQVRSQVLVYKTPEALFAYWCKYGNTEIILDRPLLAQLIDPGDVAGPGLPAIGFRADGIQTVMLKVAASDGGFIVIASTASRRGPRLRVGDLVLWAPGAYVDGLGNELGDPRAGYVGLIVATVAPAWSIKDGFKIIERFLPDPEAVR
ncbi:MAG: hypothetical protein QOG72_2469 [Sphingomonadales bacterium]|nr:hypothetical protein [Sphingomonadales bacterium]